MKMRKIIIGILTVGMTLMLLGGCAKERESAGVRVGALKGPTSLGILYMQEKAQDGLTFDKYSFQMATGADELLPLMIKGELDIALVPANVAAVLYAKTEGGVEVVDINTLGVLSLVSGGEEMLSAMDLKDKTIYLTGKGTTPEASLRYLCQAAGLAENEYHLEFKSEATEVAAVLAENPDAVGLLPQPFVTAALLQNDKLKVVMDLNNAWEEVCDTSMVTGVTVVRKQFLEENEAAVKTFLEEHKESVDKINADPAGGAELAVNAGIVAKAGIAQKAIPNCNLVCVTGSEMKDLLSDYLGVLMNFKSELVGGSLPADDFYYPGK